MAANPAQALTLVTNPGASAVLNSFDWSSLGAAGTIPTNPFTINASLPSLNTTASQPSNLMRIARQSTDWQGNFAPGDYLLTTQGNNGPITFSFNQPVAGAGTQIQAAKYGYFQAKIEAFNVAGISLGSFTADGMSDAYSDDSAIYIGVSDTTATISKLVLSVPLAGIVSTDVNDFAINTLEILSPTPQATPAPLPLLGAGAAMGWSRRLRRRLKGSNRSKW
ncbi:MAG: hypothetical protein VKJ05_06240 [Synechococcaceae cyanobacterium]|nr:hypothetical protein [Synechococcaceae cyanobacterium]